jgi:hypothetical protein
MKNEKYYTIGTFPHCNISIIERGKIDTLSTQVHGGHLPGLVHALPLMWRS